MNRDNAKEELKRKLREYVESVTKKSPRSKNYICPYCNSGTGKNKTGAFSIEPDGLHFKCFACGEYGDTIDLIQHEENLKDYNEALKRGCELFGITLDNAGTGNQKQSRNEQHTVKSIHTTTYTQTPTEPEVDYTAYFLKAHENLNKTDYPVERGLSKEILDRFNIGYDPEWRHPKSKKAQTTPRLIIPTSKYSYLARDTRHERDIPIEEQTIHIKQKVGSSHIFNLETLKTATKPVFITEGEIDALSIIQAGGEAIGLGGTEGVKVLIRELQEIQVKQLFVLSLDNDHAGERATENLEGELKNLKLEYIKNDYLKFLNVKDPNEALTKKPDEFKKIVENIETFLSEEERAEKEKYLKTATAYQIQNFIDGIADSVNTSYIPTNFKALDNTLEGGLYEGLYIIGAISSLGKTTFATQIGDQIAQTGQDVLIFSLEMARTEIMAKSISRHTVQEVLASGGDMENAKTARGITTGKRYVKYNTIERQLIKSAVKAYGNYSKCIYINEGMGDIGAEEVRKIIKNHIKYTEKKPVVIIDYLQILAPYEMRATDKQNTDKAVLELKRISRDFKIPVIGVSSFNRSNYNTQVTMEAFKESGAIEYSSDVLIGLQLKGAGEKDFNVNEAKKKTPREVELVILKNRNGATGVKIDFSYYPAFNYFEEQGIQEE